MTYKIIGAAMEVHKEMGHGFLEPVYHEALEKELLLQNIEFKSQSEVNIFYKGQKLEKTYKPDFIVFDKIIVEIKALEKLTSIEEAQLLNYLKATNIKVGLLIPEKSMK